MFDIFGKEAENNKLLKKSKLSCIIIYTKTLIPVVREEWYFMKIIEDEELKSYLAISIYFILYVIHDILFVVYSIDFYVLPIVAVIITSLLICNKCLYTVVKAWVLFFISFLILMIIYVLYFSGFVRGGMHYDVRGPLLISDSLESIFAFFPATFIVLFCVYIIYLKLLYDD